MPRELLVTGLLLLLLMMVGNVVVTNVLSLAHEMLHRRPYPPIVMIVIVIVVVLHRVVVVGVGENALVVADVRRRRRHRHRRRPIRGRRRFEHADENVAPSSSRPPATAGSGPPEDLALPASLDGIQGIEEGVLHHACEGTGEAVMRERQRGCRRVPLFPLQVFHRRHRPHRRRRRGGGRG